MSSVASRRRHDIIDGDFPAETLVKGRLGRKSKTKRRKTCSLLSVCLNAVSIGMLIYSVIYALSKFPGLRSRLGWLAPDFFTTGNGPFFWVRSAGSVIHRGGWLYKSHANSSHSPGNHPAGLSVEMDELSERLLAREERRLRADMEQKMEAERHKLMGVRIKYKRDLTPIEVQRMTAAYTHEVERITRAVAAQHCTSAEACRLEMRQQMLAFLRDKASPSQLFVTKATGHKVLEPSGEAPDEDASSAPLLDPQLFLSQLPEDSLSVPHFPTCALVGNSGVLLERGFGHLIDSHAAVFRINQAPTSGYEPDVGGKTSFRLLNNAWTHHYLSNPRRARLMKDLDANATLVISRAKPVFFSQLATMVAVERPDVATRFLHPLVLGQSRDVLEAFRLGMERASALQTAAEAETEANLAATAVANGSSSAGLSQEERRHAGGSSDGSESGSSPSKSTIKLYKGGTSPSSGLLALALMKSLCSNITLFGFSLEASRGASSTSWRYHYFNNYIDSEELRAHPHHSFTLEADFLRALVEAGLVRLCQNAGRGFQCILEQRREATDDAMLRLLGAAGLEGGEGGEGAGAGGDGGDGHERGRKGGDAGEGRGARGGSNTQGVPQGGTDDGGGDEDAGWLPEGPQGSAEDGATKGGSEEGDEGSRGGSRLVDGGNGYREEGGGDAEEEGAEVDADEGGGEDDDEGGDHLNDDSVDDATGHRGRADKASSGLGGDNGEDKGSMNGGGMSGQGSLPAGNVGEGQPSGGALPVGAAVGSRTGSGGGGGGGGGGGSGRAMSDRVQDRVTQMLAATRRKEAKFLQEHGVRVDADGADGSSKDAAGTQGADEGADDGYDQAVDVGHKQTGGGGEPLQRKGAPPAPLSVLERAAREAADRKADQRQRLREKKKRATSAERAGLEAARSDVYGTSSGRGVNVGFLVPAAGQKWGVAPQQQPHEGEESGLTPLEKRMKEEREKQWAQDEAKNGRLIVPTADCLKRGAFDPCNRHNQPRVIIT
eukprot:jgi/Mesvir1/25000/Mv16957-RA.1